jgi:hypothetical protein
MKESSADQQDKILLLQTARAIHSQLKARVEGTGIRLKWPIKKDRAETDGWKATIGFFGVNSPQLQIWLDFQTGYDERKLWFGFRSVNEKKINHLIGGVAKKFVVRRTITIKDINCRKHYQLKKQLPLDQSNVPIFENYWGLYFYFGMFDLSPQSASHTVNPKFCKLAADFFESVAGAAQTAKYEEYTSKLRKVLSNRSNLKQVIPLPSPAKTVQARKMAASSFLDFESALEMSGEDFIEQSQNRRELGEMAQDVALKAEQRRLRHAGRSDLAKRVRDVSNKPALGYDLLSFETNGKPRHIEVKTASKSGRHVSFYLSANERRKSKTLKNYYFYLVFDPRKQTPVVIYLKANQVSDQSLTSENYSVNLSLG